MRYKLVITGADSAELGKSISVPVEFFEDYHKAKARQIAYVREWLRDGYVKTAAGIFIKGTEYRRAWVGEEK